MHNVITTKNRRFNYTLVELTVTLTVIIILATVLMHALQLAKDKEAHSVCRNNLRQQANSMFSYMADYQNFFPKTPNDDYPTRYIIWDDALANYDGRKLSWKQQTDNDLTKDKYNEADHKLYLCPKDLPGKTVRDNESKLRRSYAINGYRTWDFEAHLYKGPFTQENETGRLAGISYANFSRRISEIEDPHQTIAIIESFHKFNYLGTRFVFNGTASSNRDLTNGNHETNSYLHQEYKANTLLCDGRVQNYAFEDLTGPDRESFSYSPRGMWSGKAGD